LFFTMEYVEGVSLTEHLKKNEKLDVLEVVDLLRQIFDGLSVIHQHNVVHRDMKPGNVLLSKDGLAKIGDFGVAQIDSSDLTDYDEIVGSAAYMAPESWSGRDIAPPSDIYSCGVLAYQLLTGVLPYRAKAPAEMMWKHLQEYPIDPQLLNNAVPAWLSSFVTLLLEKDAAKRPCNAFELRDYLQRALEPGQTELPTPHVGFDMRAWKERAIELGLVPEDEVDRYRSESLSIEEESMSSLNAALVSDRVFVDAPEAGSKHGEVSLLDSVSKMLVPEPVRPTNHAPSQAWTVEEEPQVEKRQKFARLWGMMTFEVALIAVAVCVLSLLFLFPLSSVARGTTASLLRDGDLESLSIVAVLTLVFHSALCALPSFAVLTPSLSLGLILRGWYRHASLCVSIFFATTLCCAGAVVAKVLTMQLSMERVGWRSIVEASNQMFLQVGLLFPAGGSYEVVMKNGVLHLQPGSAASAILQMCFMSILVVYAYLLIKRLLVPALYRYGSHRQEAQRAKIFGGAVVLILGVETVLGIWAPGLMGGRMDAPFLLDFGVFGVPGTGFQLLCAAVNWLALSIFCIYSTYRRWARKQGAL
jgi:hypothetical protein